MNDKQVRLMAVTLAAALWFAGTAVAQEDTDLITTEQPTAPEASKAPIKPEATPVPEDAKQTDIPAKRAAPKELTACAKSLLPLADSYKKAAEDLQKWIGDVDAQTSAASDRIEKLQEQIEKNEAAITKLKLEGGGNNSAKGRELAKDNKQLWSDLSAARKERSALCAGFAREAVQKARQYQTDAAEKLEGVKAQLKSSRDDL